MAAIIHGLNFKAFSSNRFYIDFSKKLFALDAEEEDRFDTTPECRPKWNDQLQRFIYNPEYNSCGVEVSQKELLWIKYSTKIRVKGKSTNQGGVTLVFRPCSKTLSPHLSLNLTLKLTRKNFWI